MSAPGACYGTAVTDTDDPSESRRRLSLAGRGYRTMTDDEVRALATLEAARREALRRAAVLLVERNTTMRNLFADGVPPSELARHLPAEAGDGTMHRSTVDRIVRPSTTR